MPLPDFTVSSHLAVELATVNAKENCQVTQVTVWIRTVEAILDVVAFINDNNLIPEILAKAGVAYSDYFNLVTLLDSYPDGALTVYEVKLSHQES